MKNPKKNQQILLLVCDPKVFEYAKQPTHMLPANLLKQAIFSSKKPDIYIDIKIDNYS